MSKIVQQAAIALMMTTLFAASAYAQATVRTDGEKKTDTAIDQAYRDTLKRSNIGVPKQSKSDPWSDLRPAADNSKSDTAKK